MPSELRRRGFTRPIGLVLAPHFSAMSVGSTRQERRRLLLRSNRPSSLHCFPWRLAPGFVPLMAELVEDSGESLFPRSASAPRSLPAHSLPKRILEKGTRTRTNSASPPMPSPRRASVERS